MKRVEFTFSKSADIWRCEADGHIIKSPGPTKALLASLGVNPEYVGDRFDRDIPDVHGLTLTLDLVDSPEDICDWTIEADGGPSGCTVWMPGGDDPADVYFALHCLLHNAARARLMGADFYACEWNRGEPDVHAFPGGARSSKQSPCDLIGDDLVSKFLALVGHQSPVPRLTVKAESGNIRSLMDSGRVQIDGRAVWYSWDGARWSHPPDPAVTLSIGTASACPDCKGTGVYEGLYAREACRTCRGNALQSGTPVRREDT